MKKFLPLALMFCISLLSLNLFAGTITVADIPDIYVADDGNPSGTVEDEFEFAEPFLFSEYVSKVGGSSSNPITVSYIVIDASPTIDSKLALAIEGATHALTTSGGQTAPVAMGTVNGLDSGAEGIGAVVLYINYINTPPLTGSAAEYDRVIKFIADNGDDTPGISPREIGVFIDDNGLDHFKGGQPPPDPYVINLDEGWVFASILGSSTGATASGALNITYNNTAVFSYWRRPLSGADPDINPLSANHLYLAIMNVTSTVALSSTPGDIPDFRIATSLANGASQLFFVSSFLSDGGSNFISPTTTPRDYNIYFEATGLAAGQTSPMVMQFEGFNFPSGSRPSLIGAAIGLNSGWFYNNYTLYNTNDTGTVIHSIADADGFALGSGTANGWAFTSFTTGGNSGATGAKAADNEGLVITSNPIGSGSYIYGSWDANPALGTSIPTFSGGVLYRATFKITTATVASGSVNQPIAQVRIQCGDSHVAAAANLYSGLGAADCKQLTNDELSTPPIDLWFYYSGATRTGGLSNRIFPAFELLVLPGTLIPNGAALTLRSYELSVQELP